MTIESLSKQSTEGCVAPGLHRKVIASASATVTLTEAESGATILIDRATITYTLPAAAVIGTSYTFHTTTSGAAGSQQVNCGAGVFFSGSLQMMEAAQTDGPAFIGNGSTHVGLDMTTAETGALAGGNFTVTRITSTLWAIRGLLVASGTITIPFTT